VTRNGGNRSVQSGLGLGEQTTRSGQDENWYAGYDRDRHYLPHWRNITEIIGVTNLATVTFARSCFSDNGK